MTAHPINWRRWTQVGGDADPLTHGGVFARHDGYGVELRCVQPVLAYVGVREAAEVGYTAWQQSRYIDPGETPSDGLLSFLGEVDATPDDDAYVHPLYLFADSVGYGGWEEEEGGNLRSRVFDWLPFPRRERRQADGEARTTREVWGR